MTSDELRHLIVNTADADLLGPCLRDVFTPFVFDQKPDAWGAFCGEVGQDLGVVPADIRIVGSARFGFSLRPGNNLKAYSETSDIDVAIVNSDLFDTLWHGLLKAVYPRPPMPHRLGGWLRERQKEVYTGWLTPLEIRLDRRIYGERARELFDLNTRWFNAFKKASHHPTRRYEDINGRLYRTWQHADLYHLHSIRSLRKALTE